MNDKNESVASYRRKLEYLFQNKIEEGVAIRSSWEDIDQESQTFTEMKRVIKETEKILKYLENN